MKLKLNSIEKNLDSLSKIAAVASKFGVLVGSVCIVSYLLRINYFPQSLSIGDSLLLITTAACFGVIYAFFVGSLVSLGILVSPITRRFFGVLVFVINLFNRRNKKPKHELAPFQWVSVLYSVFSISIILHFGEIDHHFYWNLSLLSIGLYLFYSVYISCGKKIRKIEEIRSSLILSDEKENIFKIGDANEFRAAQKISLAMILIAPLLLGGLSGEFLDAAMRAANIRIEKPIIYVKEPYATLLPESLRLRDQISPKEFIAFKDTVVLFKGFGKTTVISFNSQGSKKSLEIPNEQIIIQGR